MTGEPIPLHTFEPPQTTNIAFEISRIEDMNGLAQATFPHRHAFYELFLISEGAGGHHIDFNAYPIQPPMLFFITPGQVHYWQTESAVKGYVMLFKEDFLLTPRYETVFVKSLDFYHRLDNQPILSLPEEAAPLFLELCQNMFREYISPQWERTTVIQSFLQILLIQAQRHYRANPSVAKQTAGDILAHDFLGLVETHFANKQTVEEYASLLGVTPDHLTQVTKSVTGLAASNLLHQRILLEAKRRLSHSHQTIGEIGYDLNFKDPSYFSRFFKRETGQTPDAFRKQFQEKYH